MPAANPSRSVSRVLGDETVRGPKSVGGRSPFRWPAGSQPGYAESFNP
jgi:hypothetical protein